MTRTARVTHHRLTALDFPLGIRRALAAGGYRIDRVDGSDQAGRMTYRLVRFDAAGVAAEVLSRLSYGEVYDFADRLAGRIPRPTPAGVTPATPATEPSTRLPSWVADLGAATVRARHRLADETIATRAERGRIQVVRVAYPAGTSRSTVEPLSEWLDPADAVAALDALGAA